LTGLKIRLYQAFSILVILFKKI